MAAPFAVEVVEVVDVVVAAVPGPGSDQAAAWSTLDAGERARAAAFRDAIDRRRYVAAHGLMRAVIAARDGASPGDVTIVRDRSGRLRIVDPAGQGSVSLTHGGGLVAVALGGDIEVGIDIEPVDDRRGDRSTLARFLSAGELASLDVVAGPGRRRATAVAWTRLEAEAKGRGVSLDGLRGRERTGHHLEIDVGPGHVATLWTPAPPLRVRVDRALLASVA